MTRSTPEDFRWEGFPDLYEGEENIHKVVEFVGSGSVRDFGCGDGRLCKLFRKEDYTGYDISPNAVKMAKEKHPDYRFIYTYLKILDYAKTTFFVAGPNLVSPADINHVMDIICINTDAVVFSDVMDSKYVSDRNPFPIFRRDVEQYDEMFLTRGLVRTRTFIGKNAVYDGHPLTVARWERWERT